jgi:3-(3-hydroxy-phenyl)propionate hydroxylase
MKLPEFIHYPFEAEHFPTADLRPLKQLFTSGKQPVVIIGGGPTGLTTALGLAKHGVASVVIEADASVCAGSRAICISRRSLEIMERIGALEGFLEVGLPWTGGRSFYREQEVLHFLMPQDENQKLPPMVNLAQHHIEEILLKQAQRFPKLITIAWQTKVTDLQLVEDGKTAARLTLENTEGNLDVTVPWVVATDGARSIAREKLGLRMQGTSYEGRYIIVDIQMKSPRKTERLAYFDPPCNPGSTVLVHKQPHDIWRIDYQLRDGEDPDEAIKPEHVLPRVQSLLDMMGETAAWNPIWISIYKANALSLERYVHGPVLFAGDAAHLLPIFGVRGANSSIDDADNLAWKLAYVVKGWAGSNLLESYSQERVGAAKINISYGSKSTEFMAPPSFAYDLMRTAVLSLAGDHPEIRSLINPRQTTAINYVDSTLNFSDRVSVHGSRHRMLGSVLPEFPIEGLFQSSVKLKKSAKYLTDLLHFSEQPAFTVIVFSNSASHLEKPLQLHKQLKTLDSPPVSLFLLRPKTKIEDPREDGPDWIYMSNDNAFEEFEVNHHAAFLVRPDGHICACFDDIPSENSIVKAIDHAFWNNTPITQQAVQLGSVSEH